MMGVGPNRTQAAACGYVDVPAANVEVTKTSRASLPER